MNPTIRILIICLIVVILLLTAWPGCASSIQRKFLFYPTHHHEDRGLSPWGSEGDLIGYASEVASPEVIWLMLHGNAGQAADRAYARSSFSPRDSVFIMEYPGYGVRAGTPSRETFDEAARAAYQNLRARFPGKPIGVVGESIGTGPASMLAREANPPEKIVLIVPFDTLAQVAAQKVPWLPTRLILGSTWDNVQALADYRGPLEIYGAVLDEVIPVEHAKALAASLPAARLKLMPCGHTEWARGHVSIRLP